MKKRLSLFRPDWMIFKCPFCGSKPNIEPWHNAKNGHMISCDNNLCAANLNVIGKTKKSAIKAWNTRK
jgi:hypothetical protein